MKMLFFLLFFLLFFPLELSALGVSPTGLILSQDEPVSSLTLMNERDIPITIQITMVRWEQTILKDIYTPTDEVVVTPQIFQLPAHGSQLVRIGLEEPFFGLKERAYRLFAEEVLPQSKKMSGVQIAIRVSLPVIVKASVPVQQRLIWHSVIKDKIASITMQNKGNNVLFISQLQLFSDPHRALTKQVSTFAYILPGNKKTWKLTVLNTPKPAQIKVLVNNQDEIFDLH